MTNELLTIFIGSAIVFAIILVVLLFAWVMQPVRRHEEVEPGVRKHVKNELHEIKAQINGEK